MFQKPLVLDQTHIHVVQFSVSVKLCCFSVLQFLHVDFSLVAFFFFFFMAQKSAQNKKIDGWLFNGNQASSCVEFSRVTPQAPQARDDLPERDSCLRVVLCYKDAIYKGLYGNFTGLFKINLMFCEQNWLTLLSCRIL